MRTGSILEVLDPTGRPHLVLGTGGPAVATAAPLAEPENRPLTSLRPPPRPARPPGTWDAVVIGGGPAGSVAAGELAGRGRRVLLLEASTYPQARVGESLSPTCLEIVDRLGAGAAVRTLGSVPKTGATFLWGPAELPWSVRYQAPGAIPAALHVRRPEFDETLRQAAGARGAEVRRGRAVEEVLFEDGRACGVRLADDGPVLRASWVIDASGPTALLGRQLRILVPRPGRTGTAVWSYWTGADRLPAAAAHDSLYVGGPDRCWWYLPVGADPDMVAVGVCDRLGPPQRAWAEVDRWYRAEVAGTPLLAGLLAGAHREWPVQWMPAEPYGAARLAGPGWLLVGDAAGFVDPVLTPGVQLACEQGVSAARVVDTLLSNGTREAAALDFYDAVSRRPLDTFTALCDHLYASADSRDHGTATPEVLKHAGSAEDVAGSGRTTFLATISGLGPEVLPAALGRYLSLWAAAAERGGTPAQLGETEGFAFLSRVIHERRLAAAADLAEKSENTAAVTVAPGVEVGDHAFFDPDVDAGLIFRPAVSNRFGDRFSLTPELRRLLTGGTDAAAAVLTEDPGLLGLLAANGLLRCGSATARSAAAREADGSCVR